MAITRLCKLFPVILCLGIDISYATAYTWVAESAESDLNTTGNWTPPGPPETGSEAIFNNAIEGIDLDPLAAATFTVGTVNFSGSASVFNFTFSEGLVFSGAGIVGITGVNTNANFTITYPSSGATALSLAGAAGNYLGSASLTLTNSSTNQNYQIANQVNATTAPIVIGNGAAWVVTNIGTQTNSEAGQSNGYLAGSQVNLPQGIYTGDLFSLTLSNTGMNSSSGGSQAVGYLFGYQLYLGEQFAAADHLTITISNIGTDSSPDAPSVNQVGYVGSSQFYSQDTVVVGDSASITLSNEAFNTGGADSSYIGSVSDCQALFSGSLSAGKNFKLTAINDATSTGTGPNNSLASPNYLVVMNGSATLGDNATISIRNNGTNSSSAGGQTVSSLNNSQLYINQQFNSGNGLTINISNIGTDSSFDATMGNMIGYMSNSQLYCASTTTVGDNTSITLSNQAFNTGETSNAYIGVVLDDQAFFGGSLSAGNNFNLIVTNEGTSTGTGSDNTLASSDSLVLLNQSAVFGDNAAISISNAGRNSSSAGSQTIGCQNGSQLYVNQSITSANNLIINVSNIAADYSPNATTGNRVACMNGYQFYSGNTITVGDNAFIILSNQAFNTGGTSGAFIGSPLNDQAFFGGSLFAGKHFNLTVTNEGTSTGTGSDNTLASSDSLVLLNQSAVFGDNAAISISNAATNSSSAGSQTIGCQNGSQLYVNQSFTSSSNLIINISNVGADSSSNATTDNRIAYVGGSQFYNASNVVVGDNASITLSNSGFYEGTDSTSYVGYVQYQFYANNCVQAGKNLQLSVTNTGTNPNAQNAAYVGYNQIYVDNSCILGDGSVISATNSDQGTVGEDQIYFQGGLTLLGTATIKSTNTGYPFSAGYYGIHILNSFGGDVATILDGSSLYVDNGTLLLPFTLGSLSGDSKSTASCTQGFVFNTNAGVSATFAGTISSTNFIIKEGLGVQTLSGMIDPPDTSYVNAGTLNITGTFTGSINVVAGATLAGSGTIDGTVQNDGTLFPKEVFTITNLTNDIDGAYTTLVSVDGSYYIDVTGTTILNGGTVSVGSSNGTYPFHSPLLILTSATAIDGAFSFVTAESPLVNATLSQSSNDIYITVLQNIEVAAETANETAIARLLDGITNPTYGQSLLLSEIVDLSVVEATATLNSLSGVQYADNAFFIEGVNRQFIRRLYDPLRPILTCDTCEQDCCSDWTTWFEAGGDFSYIKHASLNGYQVTWGLQKEFCSNVTVGGALSYEADFIRYGHGSGSGYINNGLAGIYTLYHPQYIYLLGDLAYGYSASSMYRTIDIGTASYKVATTPKNSALTFYAELGGDWNTSNVVIQPFAGIEIDASWRSVIKEPNTSGWGLVVSSWQHSDVYSRLGLHLTGCRIPYNFLLSVDFGWDCQLTSQNNKVSAELASFDEDFTIYGTSLNRNSFDYALTIGNQVTRRFNVYVETTGELYSHANTFTVLGGVGYSW